MRKQPCKNGMAGREPRARGGMVKNLKQQIQALEQERECWTDDRDVLVTAQGMLENANTEYADLFDFAPVGYATLDRAGCIEEINVTGARMLGYGRKALRGRPFFPLVVPTDRRKYLLYLSRMNCMEQIAEFGFRDKQGNELRLQLVGKCDVGLGGGRSAIRLAFSDVTGLRRAEHALTESEARFRTMAEAAPVMIWMSGPDAQRTYFNRHWLEFAGRTAEEESGSGWAERVHPDDFAMVMESYFAAIRDRSEFKVEYRLRRHDGEYRWVIGRASARFTSANEFLGYTGCCMDITVRKEAEETLRRAHDELDQRVQERTTELRRTNEALQNEIRAHEQTELSLARLAAIVESSTDAILSRDLRGNVLSWNGGAERLFGHTATEIMGQPIATLVPAERVMELAAIEVRVRRGERVESLETVRLHRSGRRLDVSLTISPLRNAQGQLAGFSEIMRDISEHKRTEEALVSSETKFRGYVESAPDGVVIVNEQGRIALVNAAVERMFGYGREELYGKPFDHLIARPQRQEMLHEVQNFTASLPPNPSGPGRESAGQRKDGSEFPIEVSLNPLRTAGRVLVCTAIRDITRRKRAEEGLRRSEERYRKLFKEARAVQEILRNLSNKIIRVQEEERRKISRDLHDEVGQLLTAISVMLATLKKSGSEPHPGESKIEEAQRLLRETMDVVHNFARELRPAILDELGLLPALRSHLKAFQEHNGLQVSLRATPAAEELDIDQKTVLYRIAQESLSNVAKHAQASRVEVVLHRTREAICMEIVDDGKSFREDPRSLTRRKQRLGLLGMEERVRQAYGRFSIKPRAGRGTTVRVILPFKPGQRIMTNPMRSEAPTNNNPQPAAGMQPGAG
jgi:PAS domain S-box-containing protein